MIIAYLPVTLRAYSKLWSARAVIAVTAARWLFDKNIAWVVD